MSYGILIHGLISGFRTAFDGQWLAEYDPERNGVDPVGGFPMNAHIVTTDDPRKALAFEDVAAAWETWTRQCKRTPLRPDGKPNRPLTAFTVAIERLP